MLRSSKRQRSAVTTTTTTPTSSEPVGSGDELAHMNPSLMTERQQLAFLLRKTAPDAPPAASDSSDESSNDDIDAALRRGELPEFTVRGTRRIRRPATNSPLRSATTTTSASTKNRSSSNNNNSSRRTSSSSTSSVGSNDATRDSVQRSRVRPHATVRKTTSSDSASTSDNRRAATAQTSSRSVSLTHEREDAQPVAKKLRVATNERDRIATQASAATPPPSETKSSPSSSSDVLHIDTFDSDGSARNRDFWSLHCALCCGDRYQPLHSATSDALFLCPSCDRKYPTQRALGRV